jgi:hypothetical protein
MLEILEIEIISFFFANKATSVIGGKDKNGLPCVQTLKNKREQTLDAALKPGMCSAKTKAGKTCKNKATPGSTYCKKHQAFIKG